MVMFAPSLSNCSARLRTNTSVPPTDSGKYQGTARRTRTAASSCVLGAASGRIGRRRLEQRPFEASVLNGATFCAAVAHAPGQQTERGRPRRHEVRIQIVQVFCQSLKAVRVRLREKSRSRKIDPGEKLDARRRQLVA